MPVSRDMLVDELRDLVRLTAFEQAVATVRRTQAATEDVQRELADNATKAGERIALLRSALRQVGAPPDVFGPLVGRTGALLQAQVNQVQTLQGALLGDLTLEHQLRERARYARTLATSLGEVSVLPVLDRLESAHSETIAWLEARLAEVARTGTSAIRATPVQLAVGAVRRVALAPFAVTAGGVNAVAGLLGRLGRAAPAVASQAAGTAAGAASAAAGTVSEVAAGAAAGTASAVSETAQAVARTAGGAAQAATGSARSLAQTAAQTAQAVGESTADTAQATAAVVSDAADTAAQTLADTTATAADAVDTAAETVAATVADTAPPAADASDTALAAAAGGVEEQVTSRQEEAAQAADATAEVLEQTGGQVEVDKPPFPGYERLTGDTIMRHVNDTEDVDELRRLLAFEQAHKARKGVLAAAQTRLAALAG